MLNKIAVLFIYSASLLAGVGGIEGGGEKFQKGSHITFQKDSTWVNVLYSRTLCHDTHDFQAVINKCVLWQSSGDERNCLEFEKVKIYQPLEDTRLRCASHTEGDCQKWIEVPLVQSPKRIVEIKDQGDNVREVRKVIVPRCSE